MEIVPTYSLLLMLMVILKLQIGWAREKPKDERKEIKLS